MSEVMGIVAVAVTLVVVMAVAHWLARFPRVHGEARRKFVHMGMGLVALSFPYVFKSTWPVWVLAGIATLALWSVRNHKFLRDRLGKAVHDVPRRSYGELCFPWALALVFHWADGDAVQFIIPVLLLTFADAAGALAGMRFGMTKFQTPEGRHKSVEGFVAVFGTAYLCAHLPLLLMTEMGRAETVVAALSLALLVALAEAISVRGLDNLIIPLGSFYVLWSYSQQSLESLTGRLLAVTGLLLLALLTQRWNKLDAGACLGAVLLGYAAWAWKGWGLVVPLLGLYARHLAVLLWRNHSELPRLGIMAVVAVALTVLPWVAIEKLCAINALWPMVLGICSHSAMNLHQGLLGKDANTHQAFPAWGAMVVALCFSFVPAAFTVGGKQPWLLIVSVMAAGVWLCVWLRSCLGKISASKLQACCPEAFLFQSVMAFAVSAAALLLPSP